MAYSPVSSSSSAPFLPYSPSPRNASFEHRHSRSEAYSQGGDKEVDLETLDAPPAYARSIRNSTSKFPTMLRSRRVLAIIGILLFLVVFATFSVVHVSDGEHSWLTVPETTVADEKEAKSPYPPQVLGPPTESFRGERAMSPCYHSCTMRSHLLSRQSSRRHPVHHRLD